MSEKTSEYVPRNGLATALRRQKYGGVSAYLSNVVAGEHVLQFWMSLWTGIGQGSALHTTRRYSRMNGSVRSCKFRGLALGAFRAMWMDRNCWQVRTSVFVFFNA